MWQFIKYIIYYCFILSFVSVVFGSSSVEKFLSKQLVVALEIKSYNVFQKNLINLYKKMEDASATKKLEEFDKYFSRIIGVPLVDKSVLKSLKLNLKQTIYYYEYLTTPYKKSSLSFLCVLPSVGIKEQQERFIKYFNPKKNIVVKKITEDYFSVYINSINKTYNLFFTQDALILSNSSSLPLSLEIDSYKSKIFHQLGESLSLSVTSSKPLLRYYVNFNLVKNFKPSYLVFREKAHFPFYTTLKWFPKFLLYSLNWKVDKIQSLLGTANVKNKKVIVSAQFKYYPKVKLTLNTQKIYLPDSLSKKPILYLRSLNKDPILHGSLEGLIRKFYISQQQYSHSSLAYVLNSKKINYVSLYWGDLQLFINNIFKPTILDYVIDIDFLNNRASYLVYRHLLESRDDVVSLNSQDSWMLHTLSSSSVETSIFKNIIWAYKEPSLVMTSSSSNIVTEPLEIRSDTYLPFSKQQIQNSMFIFYGNIQPIVKQIKKSKIFYIFIDIFHLIKKYKYITVIHTPQDINTSQIDIAVHMK